jgi:hypothetical protein
VPFDTADSKTFDIRSPEWRRRRKIRRVVVLLALVLVAVPFFSEKAAEG